MPFSKRTDWSIGGAFTRTDLLERWRCTLMRKQMYDVFRVRYLCSDSPPEILSSSVSHSCLCKTNTTQYNNRLISIFFYDTWNRPEGRVRAALFVTDWLPALLESSLSAACQSVLELLMLLLVAEALTLLPAVWIASVLKLPLDQAASRCCFHGDRSPMSGRDCCGHCDPGSVKGS